MEETNETTARGVAALASAVLDEEAARQEAQARASEQVVFPDDAAPGRQLGAGLLHATRSRAAACSCSSCSASCSSFDELEGAAIQVLGPEIRSTFHISSGAIVFIGTASSAFFVLGAVPDGVARRPGEAGPDRRHREPLLRVLRLPLRLRGQRVHAVLDPLRDRHREVEQHPGPPVAHRRQLPDRHPGPDVGGDEHGRARASDS